MPDHNVRQAQALAVRLFTAGLGAAELFAAYLGVRLGFYETLASHGPMTSQQLADRAGVARRYTREWLEQQAVCGVLEVDDVNKDPEHRLFQTRTKHRRLRGAFEQPDVHRFPAHVARHRGEDRGAGQGR